MDYESMSVHELVEELVETARVAVAHWRVIDQHQVETLESAIRKAVIREAKAEMVKKPKKRVKKKTVGGTGMSEDEYYHWQHDSYPN